jgi:hypothetical protein
MISFANGFKRKVGQVFEPQNVRAIDAGLEDAAHITV